MVRRVRVSRILAAQGPRRAQESLHPNRHASVRPIPAVPDAFSRAIHGHGPSHARQVPAPPVPIEQRRWEPQQLSKRAVEPPRKLQRADTSPCSPRPRQEAPPPDSRTEGQLPQPVRPRVLSPHSSDDGLSSPSPRSSWQDWLCPYCPERMSRRQLVEHIGRWHKKVIRFRCGCKEEFFSKGSSYRHKNRIREPDSKHRMQDLFCVKKRKLDRWSAIYLWIQKKIDDFNLRTEVSPPASPDVWQVSPTWLSLGTSSPELLSSPTIIPENHEPADPLFERKLEILRELREDSDDEEEVNGEEWQRKMLEIANLVSLASPSPPNQAPLPGLRISASLQSTPSPMQPESSGRSYRPPERSSETEASDHKRCHKKKGRSRSKSPEKIRRGRRASTPIDGSKTPMYEEECEAIDNYNHAEMNATLGNLVEEAEEEEIPAERARRILQPCFITDLNFALEFAEERATIQQNVQEIMAKAEEPTEELLAASIVSLLISAQKIDTPLVLRNMMRLMKPLSDSATKKKETPPPKTIPLVPCRNERNQQMALAAISANSHTHRQSNGREESSRTAGQISPDAFDRRRREEYFSVPSSQHVSIEGAPQRPKEPCPGNNINNRVQNDLHEEIPLPPPKITIPGPSAKELAQKVAAAAEKKNRANSLFNKLHNKKQKEAEEEAARNVLESYNSYYSQFHDPQRNYHY